jgi:FdhD protein
MKGQMKREQNIMEVSMRRVNGENFSSPARDTLAVEEPLEIRLGYESAEGGGRTHKSISITMRTPGDDFELATGFLFTEGIIKSAAQIERLYHCGKARGANDLRNVVRVELKPEVTVDLKSLERHFYTSSSCGVCGKTSIEALQVKRRSAAFGRDGLQFDASVVHELPETLRPAQNVFNRTGGLHAAALFDAHGGLQMLREDVGRHNAVDKLIGAFVLAGKVPLSDQLLMVSGRISFELVQKALMGGISVLAAVGAPSSLSVELASQYQMTLIGFVREKRFNIYTGAWRIREAGGEAP